MNSALNPIIYTIFSKLQSSSLEYFFVHQFLFIMFLEKSKILNVLWCETLAIRAWIKFSHWKKISAFSSYKLFIADKSSLGLKCTQLNKCVKFVTKIDSGSCYMDVIAIKFLPKTKLWAIFHNSRFLLQTTTIEERSRNCWE